MNEDGNPVDRIAESLLRIEGRLAVTNRLLAVQLANSIKPTLPTDFRVDDFLAPIASHYERFRRGGVDDTPRQLVEGALDSIEDVRDIAERILVQQRF